MDFSDKSSEVRLDLLCSDHYECLMKILNDDQILHNRLSSSSFHYKMTIGEYVDILDKWKLKHDGLLFTIFYRDTIVGSTSLIIEDNHSARTGVWIASDFWNKGIDTCRLGLVIEKARSLHLKSLKGKINKNNRPSLRVWEKYQAEFMEDGSFFLAILRL